MLVTPNKNFHTPIAWLIIVTAFLSIPGTDLPKEDWFNKIYLDKFIHIFLFLVLVYLFYRPLKAKPSKWILAIAILAFLYGIAMEFVQKYWVIDRNFDVWDIASDGAGCAIAYFYIAYRRRRKKIKSQQRKSKYKK